MSTERDTSGAPRTAGASPATAALYNVQLGLERVALRAAVDLAAAAPDDVVLDVATGTGGLLAELARRADAPRHATGVDASAAMLRRVPALPTGWRVHHGDSRRLPVADGGVDIVTCSYLLHLLDAPARRATLREIARVLAPGGRAVIVTLIEPRGLAGAALLGPLQRMTCRLLGPGSGWCALDPSAELAAAGLVARRRRVSTRGYASLCLLAERA